MKRVFAASLLALAVAMPAAAQRTTGEIIGKIVDESGSVLPGVTVTLRGAGVAGAPTVVTSESGMYRFPVLPPGTYSVDYTLTGFSTLKREDIPVAVGSIVELNVSMKVGALEESITVSGESPVVNVVTSEVSTTYNRQWVESAPVKRFSYFDLVNSAPGVSATSNVGQATAAQSLGNSTNENSYQIDGTDISSTPWLSTDAVEEVEVLQLGASAEYGNVQGAVFNIVTRMGTNQFHGDGAFYLQTDGMTGRNTPASVDGGFPYHRDRYRDASIQATGPFIRDKFFFFGSLHYQRDWDSQPGVDPNSPALNDSRRVFWKFNYNITQNHSVDARVSQRLLLHPGHRLELHRAEHDRPQPRRQPDAEPRVYRRVVGQDLIEARYSGFWLHSSVDPNEPGQNRVGPRFEDQDTGQITGNITTWQENRSWRYGFQTKLSHMTGEVLGERTI